MSASKICDFYNNQTVFLTGGTGFLGKALIEKLLRDTNVAKIYILIRNKRGKDGLTRYQQLLNNKVFEKLRQLQPNFETRVEAISGEVSCENFDLAPEIYLELTSRVNIVFHAAAVVALSWKIQDIYRVNVKGTANVVKFCKEVKYLKSFVYVSTAFCHNSCTDETFYKDPNHDDLERMVEEIETSKLTELTTRIVKKWPNTYVLSKVLAELYVKNNAQDIPVAIFRPAGITAAYNEPIKGWIDDRSGLTRVVSTIALGFVRLVPLDFRLYAYLNPIDMTIAALVAIAWDTAQKRENIPIYNYVSSVDNPITWIEFFRLWEAHTWTNPPGNLIRKPSLLLLKSTTPYFPFLSLYYNYLPAARIDFQRMLSFKKSQMISKLKKFDAIMESSKLATEVKWEFTNSNTTDLWKKMSDKDKELFPFDFSNFQWLEYVRRYYLGIKKYILKDNLDTIPRAKL